VLEAVRQSGSRLVFGSSFSVYGGNPRLPWCEVSNLEPDTPYGLCKKCEEELLSLWNDLYGVEVVVCRFSNVFGPGSEKHLPLQVLNVWFSAKRKGEALKVFGSETSRDFTWIWDVVDALVLLMVYEQKWGVFNVCSGKEVNLKRLARAVGDLIIVENLPFYECSRWVGDNEKLRDLGWKPSKCVFDWVREVKNGKK